MSDPENAVLLGLESDRKAHDYGLLTKLEADRQDSAIIPRVVDEHNQMQDKIFSQARIFDPKLNQGTFTSIVLAQMKLDCPVWTKNAMYSVKIADAEGSSGHHAPAPYAHQALQRMQTSISFQREMTKVAYQDKLTAR